MKPTEIIQRLRLVLADKTLTLAERVAVAAIVLHAGRDGIAWPGYRRIRSVYGVNLEAIVKALGDGQGRGKALGRHLEQIGRAAHGTRRFRVLPPGASVSVNRTLDDPAAFGSDGASVRFPSPQRSVSAAPAFRPAEQNVNSTDKRELTTERKKDRGCAAPPASTPLLAADVQPITETATASTKEKGTRPEAAADPRVRAFLDFFCAAYREAHGRAYLVARGKDGAIVKRLLAALDGNGADALAELKAAAAAMLADTKWGRENASLNVLAGQINSWCAKSQEKERTHVRRAGELAYSREAEPLPRALADKPAGGPGA